MDITQFTEDFFRKDMEIKRTNFDNLFNADHRNLMIREVGGTEAEFVKVENLRFLRGPFDDVNETQKQWLPYE